MAEKEASTTTGCRLRIDKLWHGGAALADEGGEVRWTLADSALRVEVAATFHGDPAPALTAGRADGLWNFEVVELFLANEGGHYLELEFGPHGHYLALRFTGVRERVDADIPVAYQAEIGGGQWRALAVVPAWALPDGISRANAYAIHGQGEGRRFLAAWPVPGPRPDFHQPHRFPPLASPVPR